MRHAAATEGKLAHLLPLDKRESPSQRLETVKDHTFGATALTSWTQSKYTSVNAQGEGQLVDSYLWHNLGANDKSSYVIGSDYIQHQTFSYALRFNYSYKGRYMLTVSNRWDGGSQIMP